MQGAGEADGSAAGCRRTAADARLLRRPRHAVRAGVERHTGIGASRMFCEFKRIEKLGATSYRVTEQCRELTDSRGGQARTGTYAISNNSAFAWTAADGS